MDALLALVRHHELAERLQAYGLLVEPEGKPGDDPARTALCLRAGRLDPGVDGLLRQAGLHRVETKTLASDEAVTAFAEAVEALVAAEPSRFILRPAQKASAPAIMPRSQAWLERYYGPKGFSPLGERKPSVVDYGRSGGPFITSIDDEPLVFFDASSQIATHAEGLGAPHVQRARDEGGYGAEVVANPDSSAGQSAALAALAALCREHLHPNLHQITFANSGAEANEKALHLARQNGRGGHRLLAMKGSFHGRTLLPLHGTWNPVKRGPFEFAGYEASWVDFPRHLLPQIEPELPAGWVAAWSGGDGWSASDDALLSAEVEILRAVEAQLASEPIFAVIGEVMQGEGGDNYATRRFYCGLLAICRRHDVPLVIDEVQTGFGLGGPLFWHSSLRFEDAAGAADAPDLVTVAKKAQLGLIASRFEDDEPTEVSSASAVRGLAQARAALATDHDGIAAFAEASLKALAAGLPEGLVTRVRGKALAWAIDLPSGAVVNRLLSERFWRGYLTYIAGAQTLRFRLSPVMTPETWQRVVDALDANLRDLIEAVGFETPEQFAEDVAALPAATWTANSSFPAPRFGLAEGYRLIDFDAAALEAHMDEIMVLEAEAYEPERRETADGLRGFLQLKGYRGRAILSADGAFAGFCMGAALEGFGDVDGCQQDSTWGQGQSYYSLEMLVAAEHRGRGLGRALKAAQLDAAREAGFRFVCGRNRVGGTVEMGPLNRSFGAYVLRTLDGQYGGDGHADYYRIPLFPGRLDVRVEAVDGVDLGSGLAQPLGAAPATLIAAARRGSLGGALLNKLSLCNFTTPDTVRFAELMQALAPEGCDHALYTSGRAEMVDKALRCIKYHNREADVVLAFEGTYVGHTTAAARSVSDGGEAYFDWPKLPHPARVGEAAALEALDEAIEQYGDRILTLVIEPIGERSGLVIPAGFYDELEARRQEAGLRVTVSETVTGGFRSGTGPCFFIDTCSLTPDQVLWYTGGQLGLVFCNDTVWVDKPLQLISTWDGDELSMIRCAHHIRWALRHADGIGQRAALMARMLSDVEGASSLGLFAHIAVEDPSAVADALASAGLRVRASAGGLALVPALNMAARPLAAAVQQLVAGLGD